MKKHLPSTEKLAELKQRAQNQNPLSNEENVLSSLKQELMELSPKRQVAAVRQELRSNNIPINNELPHGGFVQLQPRFQKQIGQQPEFDQPAGVRQEHLSTALPTVQMKKSDRSRSIPTNVNPQRYTQLLPENLQQLGQQENPRRKAFRRSKFHLNNSMEMQNSSQLPANDRSVVPQQLPVTNPRRRQFKQQEADEPEEDDAPKTLLRFDELELRFGAQDTSNQKKNKKTDDLAKQILDQ